MNIIWSDIIRYQFTVQHKIEGFALITAGLLFLFFALDVPSGAPGWAGRFAAASAVAALALYGVLQAVDGVALKRAVDAWPARRPSAGWRKECGAIMTS